MQAMSVPDQAAYYVYLARRLPGLDDAEFARRWRSHAALAAGEAELMQCISGYTQARVRHDLEAAAGLHSVWDAIGATRCPDIDALHRMLACRPTREILQPDELRVFAAPCAEFALVTREVLRVGAARQALQLTQFVRRRADLGLAEFSQRWAEHWRAWLAARPAGLAAAVACTLQVAIEPAACGYDGYACFALPQAEDLKAWLQQVECTDASATISLLTQVTSLWQADAPCAPPRGDPP